MSNFAQVVQAVDTLLSTRSVITKDLWESLTTQLPEHYTLASLAEEASALDQSGQLKKVKAHLIALQLFIAKKDSLKREEGDDAAPQRLCDAVAAVIAPRRISKEEDDENTTYEETVQRSYELGPHGLSIISECVKRYASRLSEDSLLTVISFLFPTSSSSPAACGHSGDQRQSTTYPWINVEATRLSLEIILQQRDASYFEEDDLIVETILKGYLRPMFSKSRPKTVTQSGRKAEFPDEHDPHRGLEDENSEVKPWKYADHRTLAVFEWAVGRAKEELISKQWPLFIPVLLTLIDDGSARVRTRGLAILNTFLLKFPNNIIRDTGLASVFEDALFPTFHFLPSLTPEQESIQLLGPAYTALLTLARKIDAKVASGVSKSARTTKFNLLDKMLRDGIFSAYFHAKEHVRIVEVLCLHMSDIIQEMGIHAVKHLKDLIPMQSEIMTNPFASLAPDTLRAALKSLNAVLTNCWPRLSTPAYQDELIKILVICFLNVHDEGKDDLADVKATLIKTAAVFLNASTPGTADKGGINPQEKVKSLITQEPLLADLFKQI